MIEILSETLEDSIKLIPFLFLTYLFMEYLEHRTGSALSDRIRSAGKTGPIWGAVLGVIPQCGFSAAASSLYAGKVITVGTLIAVFLSTSDEMLPIMISESAPLSLMIKLLAGKAAIAMISGLAVELIYEKLMGQKTDEIHIHEVCEKEKCHCEDGILKSAIKHTVRIFIYILIVTLALNILIAVIGEDVLANVLGGLPVIGEMAAALVGLIPNCASSVVITELYLEGIIGAGPMMAGLLVNAGVGFLVLYRLNADVKENVGIVATMYGIGVFWGVMISAIQILI